MKDFFPFYALGSGGILAGRMKLESLKSQADRSFAGFIRVTGSIITEQGQSHFYEVHHPHTNEGAR